MDSVQPMGVLGLGACPLPGCVTPLVLRSKSICMLSVSVHCGGVVVVVSDRFAGDFNLAFLPVAPKSV